LVHKYLRFGRSALLVATQGQKKTKPVSIGLRPNDECYSERPAIRRATPMGLDAPCPIALHFHAWLRSFFRVVL